MSNNLDKQYTDLLQDILDNGVQKGDRTGTGTISLFGRQIRHKMSDGFPLLTTKRMPFKTIVTELLWFLRGDTNIKYLHDNGCHIWDGDYKKSGRTDGELGPIYGKQWRSWNNYKVTNYNGVEQVDQIQNLINDLKTNPDSRRLMVNAWNVGELDQMVLPPCHYGFQVYTRELTWEERYEIHRKYITDDKLDLIFKFATNENLDKLGVPTRAISLMWNQRSVDTFLGLPFNIASYGLLLEIIAKAVNMVPDELIGNLGDTHLYLNHIEQAKEQIGRDYTLEERLNMVSEEIQNEFSSGIVNLPNFLNTPVWSDDGKMSCLDDFGVPRRTREPYPLPTSKINSGNENWHLLDIDEIINSLDVDITFKVDGYQSHPPIKAPLSN
jgi:thymidylate synthase